ncbi:ABC transporter ATP-binding protein [Patulibacter americanus]|uniref:ABC transporter ATP-binding protein n=1 Tax=Patulibacter americanus TaxID=588672 RepID=UPI0003B5D70D|nr:ABC transporter ATP-binding protein [Patulibacter americanus]
MHPSADGRTAAPPILSGRGLRKGYGDAPVLHDVDVDVHRGRALAIVGPSGSGKSTLLHVLAAVLAPDAGTVHVDGRRVDDRSEKTRAALRRSTFGFVFQQGLLVPELDADENVALPMLLDGAPRNRAIRTAREWLGRLGIGDLAGRRPGEMSGGQMQRVAVARALAHEPAVVFADEPTGALDTDTAEATADLLFAAARSTGAALVVITHDLGLAARADEAVAIRRGVLEPAALAPVAVAS